MGNFGAWVAAHRKGILGYLAALGGICTIVASLTDLGPVAKYAGVIVAVLAGLGVYHTPNQPGPGRVTARAPVPPGRQHR
jgi:hypothetical protein